MSRLMGDAYHIMKMNRKKKASMPGESEKMEASAPSMMAEGGSCSMYAKGGMVDKIMSKRRERMMAEGGEVSGDDDDGNNRHEDNLEADGITPILDDHEDDIMDDEDQAAQGDMPEFMKEDRKAMIARLMSKSRK